MKYNPDIHHRKSVRIPGYDYAQDGWYFVTICTHNHNVLLGNVVNGEMVLNEYGQIVSKIWKWLPEQYKYIKLHEWIIMPNHLHGIIEYHNDGRGGARTAPTDIKIKPLGRIIGAFKTVSTKHINKIQNTPGHKLWQRNYYEHIIRNEKDLNRIREYIIYNPLKWPEDKYYV